MDKDNIIHYRSSHFNGNRNILHKQENKAIKQRIRMGDTTATILKMAVPTTAGVSLSMTNIEATLRIISLAVPTVLSILVYLKNRKKKK